MANGTQSLLLYFQLRAQQFLLVLVFKRNQLLHVMPAALLVLQHNCNKKRHNQDHQNAKRNQCGDDIVLRNIQWWMG